MGANQICDAACHVQKQMVSDNTGKKKSSGCSCLRYNSIKPSTAHTPPLKTELPVFYISLKALSIPVFVSRPGLSSSTQTLLFASGLTPESGEEPEDLLILRTMGCLSTKHTPWVFSFLAIVKKSHSLFNSCLSHGQTAPRTDSADLWAEKSLTKCPNGTKLLFRIGAGNPNTIHLTVNI